MKIKIISKQIFEDYEDKIEEIYDKSNIKFIDKNIIINYNGNEIVYDKQRNSIEIIREENNIFVKLNNECESVYETPYGKFSMKTFGEKILIEEKPFKMTIEYKIFIENMKEYRNIIEILEV